MGTTQTFAQTKKKSKAKSSKTHKVRSSSDNGEYYNGHKIYTGPRGGKYYINSNGKKTYI
jgi:colicin import membrane protein